MFTTQLPIRMSLVNPLVMTSRAKRSWVQLWIPPPVFDGLGKLMKMMFQTFRGLLAIGDSFPDTPTALWSKEVSKSFETKVLNVCLKKKN